MFEESVEGFIVRWRGYANPAKLYSHIEGSPLLECHIEGHILNVFERTNPYASLPGNIQLIVNPTAQRVDKPDDLSKKLEVTGISQVHACGLVLVRNEQTVVIDAGFPLVVSVFDPLPDDVAAGDWLEFQSLNPIHGFVLSATKRASATVSDEDI